MQVNMEKTQVLTRRALSTGSTGCATTRLVSNLFSRGMTISTSPDVRTTTIRRAYWMAAV